MPVCWLCESVVSFYRHTNSNYIYRGSFSGKRGYYFGQMFCGHCDVVEFDSKDDNNGCFQEIFWNRSMLVRVVHFLVKILN